MQRTGRMTTLSSVRVDLAVREDGQHCNATGKTEFHTRSCMIACTIYVEGKLLPPTPFMSD